MMRTHKVFSDSWGVTCSRAAVGFSVLVGLSVPVSKPLAQAPQPATPVWSADSVLDGVFTSAQASRGEQTFSEACARCHDTREFTAGRFRLEWTGRTAGDLYETISTLMPE